MNGPDYRWPRLFVLLVTIVLFLALLIYLWPS